MHSHCHVLKSTERYLFLYQGTEFVRPSYAYYNDNNVLPQHNNNDIWSYLSSTVIKDAYPTQR